MCVVMLRGGGIDRHAADGVEDCGRGGAMVMRVVLGMIAVPAAAGGRRGLVGWRSTRGGGLGSSLGGTAASGRCFRRVMVPVFGVVHCHAPALQHIP
ncbi:hypothetical protein CDS [Bradyrhizobium sp.]|nr:hypothetical protein CDS [Bradyrhizobium sp.]